MEDDFEVEFEDKQETAPETQENETPVETDDKQDQPSDESKETNASEEASEEETVVTEEESPETPKFDADLEEWAKSKGIDVPETDREKSLAQKLRDSDRQFTKNQEAKKNTDKLNDVVKEQIQETPTEVDDIIDPLEKKVLDLEKQNKDERDMRLRSEFTIANNLTPEITGLMADIFKEKIEAAKTVEAKEKVINYFNDTDNLKDWLDLAEARQIKSSGKEQIVDEATKAERARIAKLDKAGGSAPRNAKNTVPKENQSELDKLWSED